MSDFGWLERIVRARTPPPWRPYAQQPEVSVIAKRPIADLTWCMHEENRTPEGNGLAYQNADFIAAMGTLADKIMAVIKAAEEVKDTHYVGYAPNYEEKIASLRKLREATIVLQAAKDEL